LREAAGPVFDGLGRLASRRGITLSLALEDDAGVRVDPQDLQEMVGNLLENALQWAQQQVRVTSESRDGGVLLVIEDDGPGMSDEQSAAALGRGARLDEGRSGSGLGLAIVDDLMALYGGELRLERSALGGLAAHVWLPSSPLVGTKPTA
ncbi:ATP-binding protein, partial [Cobetia marina]